MNKNVKSHDEVIAHIKQKQEELKNLASLLKKDFIGLDKVIDEIIENIKIWYIFPELQIRPTIVCLWGLTGVGKTDLVRKMVSYMKIQDRFLEIEMCDNNDTTKTIQKRLEESSINADDHALLFLDEFQKFRTVLDNGESNNNSMSYSDVWTLLSDGKFNADLTKKTELMEQLLYSKYDRDSSEYYEANQSEDDKKKKNKKKDIFVERTYNTPVYMARRVKRLFKLDDSLEDIMKWNDEEIYKLYSSLSNNPSLYEAESYKKMLIIISGNLDEAYHTANNVGDTDIDADYYHELSNRLTIIDIKNSLKKRFRPEQIARFGNSHVLYPSLSKDNYQKIIINKCKQINDLIFESKGIEIIYDQSVYDVIYNNGVFPTQGVRPLLSTITNILSSALPTFIFECLLNKVNKVKIGVDKSKMFATINGQKIKVIIPTVLDKIRSETNSDQYNLVGVHEVGHALVYCLIHKTPPKQISINCINPFINGFVIPHKIENNKESLLQKLKILMAGRAAEEIVFGSKLISSGAARDIIDATNEAWLYVARLGFDGYGCAITQKREDMLVYNNGDIGKIVEQMIQDAKKDATDIINKNLSLFKELVQFVLKYEKVNISDFISIFHKYNITLTEIEEGENIMVGYKELVESFLNNNISDTNTHYVDVVKIKEPKSNELIKV